MEISRRRFLEMFGALAGGMALTSCGIDPRWSVPDELVKLAQRGPGIETWKNTLCGQCGGGCGIKVRLVDGVPVKIEGNPIFPLNRGGMCPQGAAGLDSLYNLDRIKGPMLRTGKRGSGSWKPVSWDEAFDKVVTRLAKLRSEENAHKVAILKEDSSILMDDIFSQFLKAYGSPNLIDASDNVGNFEKPGGVVVPENIPLKELPALKTDRIAKSGLKKPALAEHKNHPVGLKSMQRFLDSILSEKPYDLDTLFIYNTNPLFTSPHQHKLTKILEKIPFIVSFSDFIDETTEYADIILPGHSWLEKWDLSRAVPTVNFPFLAIQKPVVKPFYDTKHPGDVMLAIASGIKGMSLSFKDSLEYIKYRVEGIFIASVFVSIGMWLERLIIIVPSLVSTRLPYTTGFYIPTLTEIGLFVGGIALFCLGYLLFARFFPLITVWEIQEGRDQGIKEVNDRLRSYLPDKK